MPDEQQLLAALNSGNMRTPIAPSQASIVYNDLVNKFGGDADFANTILANITLHEGLRTQNPDLLLAAGNSGTQQYLRGFDSSTNKVVGLDSDKIRHHAVFGGLRGAIAQQNLQVGLVNENGAVMAGMIGITQGIVLDPILATYELFNTGEPTSAFGRFLFDAQDYENDILAEHHPLMYFGGYLAGNIVALTAVQEFTAAKMISLSSRIGASARSAKLIGVAGTSLLAGVEEVMMTPDEVKLGGTPGQFAIGALGGGAITWWARTRALKTAMRSVSADVIGIKTGEGVANSKALVGALDDASLMAEVIKRKALPRKLFGRFGKEQAGRVENAVVKAADKVKAVIAQFQEVGAKSVGAGLDEVTDALADLLVKADSSKLLFAKNINIESKIDEAEPLIAVLDAIARVGEESDEAAEVLFKAKLAKAILANPEALGDHSVRLASKYIAHADAFVHSRSGIVPAIRFSDDMLGSVVSESALIKAKNLAEKLAAEGSDTAKAYAARLETAVGNSDAISLHAAMGDAYKFLGADTVTLDMNDGLLNMGGAAVRALDTILANPAELIGEDVFKELVNMRSELASNLFFASKGFKGSIKNAEDMIEMFAKAVSVKYAKTMNDPLSKALRIGLGSIADQPEVMRVPLIEKFNAHLIVDPEYITNLNGVRSEIITRAVNNVQESYNLNAPMWRGAYAKQQAAIGEAKVAAEKAAKAEAAAAKAAKTSGKASKTTKKTLDEWLGNSKLLEELKLDVSSGDPAQMERFSQLASSPLYKQLSESEGLTRKELVDAIKAFFGGE